MTHKERMKLLRQWEGQIAEINSLYKAVDNIFGDYTESKFFNVVSDLAMKYTKTVSDLTGDTDWLEWHWLENDMGARKMEAKAANWKKMRKITNLEVLCKLIEADIK